MVKRVNSKNEKKSNIDENEKKLNKALKSKSDKKKSLTKSNTINKLVSSNKPSKVSSSLKNASKNSSNNPDLLKSNWDITKIEKDQMLSETCYYKIEKISNKSQIDVIDHKGMKINTSIEVLEECISGNHFEKEVPMTMTGLAEILENCKEDVFTCCFHKQTTVDRAKQIIDIINISDLKDSNKVSKLAKEIISGDLCTMTCHLVKMENILGRSSVIDLNADLGNQFRQIDHRSIEWIILRNVKYYLKKTNEKTGEIVKHMSGDPLWNSEKAEKGNWFSCTNYFRIISWDDKEADLKDLKGETYEVSNSILESSMYNSAVFAKEEKVTLTEIGKIFKKSDSKVFTVCFNAKIDISELKDKLSKLNKNDLEDSKSLARELITGSEKTIVGRLTSSEAKLGRSLVLTFPNNTLASVDHRTIKWLILKNIKYSIK